MGFCSRMLNFDNFCPAHPFRSMPPPATDAIQGLELLGAGQKFLDELCELLSSCHLLEDMQWAEIKQVARYVQAYQAPAGTVLFREGDEGSFLCLLLSGYVDIRKHDSAGRDKNVARVSSGKTLGEMAVIDGERRSASCVTASPIQLAILTKGNFDRLAEDHPLLAYKITLKITRLLSQRLRHASGLLVDYLSD